MEPAHEPDWTALADLAIGQEGVFTTAQAAEVGYSPQLLAHHVRAGRFARVRRGIYRLTHFPGGAHEHLIVEWLWSERRGVFSHETALSLHRLSDVMPAQITLTMPIDSSRKRHLPADVELHRAEVPDAEREWSGPVPITRVARTLNDCARAGLSPDLLEQAARQALRRGLVQRSEIPDVLAVLLPYGGLAA